MKTAPAPTSPALQADPRIVRKTRRDNAAFVPFTGMLGEVHHDYLHQPARTSQALRPLEFGRPGW